MRAKQRRTHLHQRTKLSTPTTAVPTAATVSDSATEPILSPVVSHASSDRQVFNSHQPVVSNPLASLPPLPPGKLPRSNSLILGANFQTTSTTNATTTTTNNTTTPATNANPAVSFSLYKTINTVIKSGRKIIVRVCDVSNVKTKLRMFNLYSTMNKRNGAEEKEARVMETTGHDRFCQERPSR